MSKLEMKILPASTTRGSTRSEVCCLRTSSRVLSALNSKVNTLSSAMDRNDSSSRVFSKPKRSSARLEANLRATTIMRLAGWLLSENFSSSSIILRNVGLKNFLGISFRDYDAKISRRKLSASFRRQRTQLIPSRSWGI